MTGGLDVSDAEFHHEPNRVGVAGVVMFFVALSAAIVVVFLLLRGLLLYFDARKAEEAPPAPPLSAGARLPPQPRLQGAPGSERSPAEDIRRFREQEDQLLGGYGWVDEPNGVIRIPIEQAKRMIEEKGLPVMAPGAAQSPRAKP
jgi:hypothetical protein